MIRSMRPEGNAYYTITWLLGDPIGMVVTSAMWSVLSVNLILCLYQQYTLKYLFI